MSMLMDNEGRPYKEVTLAREVILGTWVFEKGAHLLVCEEAGLIAMYPSNSSARWPGVKQLHPYNTGKHVAQAVLQAAA